MKLTGILIRALTVGSVSALAMTTSLTAAHAKEATSFTIPGGQLSKAVKAYIGQSGQQIIYKTKDLRNIKTSGFSGRYQPKQALQMLLRGTGIAVRWDRSGAAVLYKAAPARYIQTTSLQPAQGQASDVNTTRQEASTEAEIIVTGRRLDQQNSINAKREAKQIIDVITADDTSRLPDDNIAEVLGRIPGVNFQKDSLTGEGVFINIRGLDAALTNVQFDGINSGLNNVGNRNGVNGDFGGDRRTKLNGITADEIAEIRVSKSLLPSDEGAGIGGAVNIIRATPLRVGKDIYKFNLEGRYGEFTKGDLGYEIGGSVNKILSDNFAINFGANFRRREIRSISEDRGGIYLRGIPRGSVVTADGRTLTPADYLDDDDIFPGGTVFDIDHGNFSRAPDGFFSANDPNDILTYSELEYTHTEETRDSLTFSGSADYQIADHTLFTLGGRYSKETATGLRSSILFDFDDDESILNTNGTDSNFGDFETITTLDDQEIGVNYSLRDRIETNGNLFLRGETDIGKLNLKYQASWAFARSDNPRIDFDFNTQSVYDNLSTADDALLAPFVFQNGFLAPNPAGVDVLDAGNVPPPGNSPREIFANPQDFLTIDTFRVPLEQSRKNNRYALKFDADYALEKEFGGLAINNIAFGAKFERSDINDRGRSVSTSDARNVTADGTFTADRDLDLEDTVLGGFGTELYTPGNVVSLDEIGNPLSGLGLDGIPTLNRGRVAQIRDNFLGSFAGEIDLNTNDLFIGQEDTYAAYGQIEFEIGSKFSAVAGLRVEHYTGRFTNNSTSEAQLITAFDEDTFRRGYNFIRDTEGQINLINGEPILDPDEFERLGGILSSSSSNTEILPRLNFQYEFTDNLKFRGGAGIALARPTHFQLGRASSTRFRVFSADPMLDGDPDIQGDGDPTAAPGTFIPAGVSLADLGELTADQVAFVEIFENRGNPDLNNAKSFGLDGSLEWYPTPGTSITLGGFYKKIKDFIFIGQEIQTGRGLSTEFIQNTLDPAAVALIAGFGGVSGISDNQGQAGIPIIRNRTETSSGLVQPENSDETGTVWGLELGFNHQFRWAPGFLQYVGVSGNVTYNQSKINLEAANQTFRSSDAIVQLGFVEEGTSRGRQVPFFNAPDWSGNGQLYYDDSALEIALSYRYTGSSFGDTSSFGFQRFTGSDYQLDLYAEYQLPIKAADVGVYFEIQDLTDGGLKSTVSSTIGRGGVGSGGTYNGREFRAGLRARF